MLRPRWIVLVVLGVAGLGLSDGPTSSPLGGLRAEIVLAMGGCRLIEARLIGLPFSPWQAGGCVSEDRVALTRLRRGIIRALGRHPTAELLAEDGLLQLAAGRFDQAIEQQEKAVAQEPSSPLLLTDLAAFYLARASSPVAAHPDDLILALTAVDKSLATLSVLPEARFNRALALEQLSLRAEARTEWRQAALASESSGWAREARVHHDRLSKTAEDLWRPQEQLLATASRVGEATTVREIVAAFPQSARLYIERYVLKAWAEAVSRGDPLRASQALGSATLVSSEYERIAKDTLLKEAVNAISQGDESAVVTIAAGYLSYLKALNLYDRHDYSNACDSFLLAQRDLKKGGSPFAFWARFFAAACDYHASRFDAALAALGRLDTEAPQGYTTLRGRIFWLRGLILYVEAQPMLAQASYLQALRCFEATGEREFQAALHYLLSEVDFFLGNRGPAWRHMLSALEGSRLLRDPQRAQLIFLGAALAASRESHPQAALHFQEEAVRIAERSGHPEEVALALKERATTAGQLSRLNDALTDLGRAKQAAAEADDDRLTADILLAESRIRSPFDPLAALAALSTALPLLRKTHYQEKLSLFYLDRGDIFLHLGRRDEAEADFRAGIAELEQTRSAVSLRQRQVFLDRYHALYDRLLQVQVAQESSLCAGFETAERSRSPHLFDRMRALSDPGAVGPRPGILRLAQLRPSLPASTLLVEYAMVDDSLLIWAVRRDDFRCIRVIVKAGEIQARVADLRAALTSGEQQRVLLQAEVLHDLLISRLSAILHPGDVIAVVPDATLEGLPFSLLRERSSHRFLVEDHDILFAASATMFVRDQNRGDMKAMGHNSIFVIGDPAFDPAFSPDLKRLEVARVEAGTVVRLYKRSSVVVADEATKSRLLAAFGRYDVIQFAGHAVPDSQAGGFSRLVLAPERGEAGFLFAHELEGRDFRGTGLVVLAGCGTGGGAASATEGIESLAKPLLGGGVPAVAVTLWSVDDTAAAVFSLEIHRRFAAGADAVKSVAGAQRALLKSAIPSLANPITWGAFALWGTSASLESVQHGSNIKQEEMLWPN